MVGRNHFAVGQLDGLVLPVDVPFGAEHLPLGVDQMHVAEGRGLVIAAQEVDPIGGQRRGGLIDHRVAGDHEGVGLGVVLELAAGYVDGAVVGLQHERRGRRARLACPESPAAHLPARGRAADRAWPRPQSQTILPAALYIAASGNSPRRPCRVRKYGYTSPIRYTDPVTTITSSGPTLGHHLLDRAQRLAHHARGNLRGKHGSRFSGSSGRLGFARVSVTSARAAPANSRHLRPLLVLEASEISAAASPCGPSSTASVSSRRRCSARCERNRESPAAGAIRRRTARANSRSLSPCRDGLLLEPPALRPHRLDRGYRDGGVLMLKRPRHAQARLFEVKPQPVIVEPMGAARAIDTRSRDRSS